MKFLGDYKIYNNLIFLLPIVVGIYIQQPVFTALAVLIFITSTHYHVVLVRTPERTKLARRADRAIAIICYVYLSYFIFSYKHAELQAPLFVGLTATLLVFLFGKYKKSDVIHACFHTSIAVVAGLIGIL